MNTARQPARTNSASDTRRHLHELTSQQWGFGHWSNPATAALAVYVAGMLLHATGTSPWWVLLAGIVFTLTFVLATMGKHTRVLGIAYSAALSAAVTGWLTYAAGHATFTVHDWPATRDHLVALGIGALPFAVVYALLVHGRTEAREAAAAEERRLIGERKRWHDACVKAGIKGWYYERATDTTGGQAVTMTIQPGGTPYRQAVLRIEDLELALKAPYHGAVRIEKGGHAGQAVILLNQRNMLAETLDLPADTSPLTITEPITPGVYEDREPARVVYAYQSSLTIGQRDGGKTNHGNVRIAAFQRMDNVLLWLVDFKQGSVARPWLVPYATGQVQRPAFDWVATDITGLEAMLDALDRIGNNRAHRRTGDKITPTHQMPAIRLDVDEVADVLADPANERVAAKLIKALRKHRSEGIDVDLASQRATMSFLGSHARDIGSQVGILNAFHLSDPSEVFNTLNVDRSRIGGVDPSTFEYAGTMLTIAAGVRKMPIKTYRLHEPTDTPTVIPGLARRCAAYRPTLEPDAAAAAGPAYARRWHTDTARALLVTAAHSVGMDYRPAHATTPPAGPATTPASEQTASSDTTDTETGEQARIIPLHRPASTHGHDLHADLIAQFGHEEGGKRWQRVQAATVLQAMHAILTDTPAGALPTRELLDRLAARDTQQWGELTGAKLAQLIATYPIKPQQLGEGKGPWQGNPRGYRLADVATAIEHGPAATGETA